MSDLAHLKKRLSKAFDASATGWGNQTASPTAADPFDRFHGADLPRPELVPQDDARGEGRALALVFGGATLLVAAIALSIDNRDILLFLAGSLVAAAIIFLAHTLTERKTLARERALALAEREARADREWTAEERDRLLASMHEGFGDIAVIRDRQGRIIAANSVLQGLAGRGDLSGETLDGLGFRFQPGMRRGAVLASIDTPDGTKLFAWDDVVIRDPVSGLLTTRSMGRDVTEENRAALEAEGAVKRAEQANAAKSRLLATVAHDIRTPLTGLLGMADLLDNSSLNATQRNYVAGLRQSGQVLSHLVEDLLDFATMEAGRFKLSPVAEQPRKLIEGIVEMLAPRAHFKGLEIASFVAPDVPDSLVFDPARLRQVLFNIAGNAVKFTAEGGVSVSAFMRNGDFVLAVSDTGPGMNDAERERIFDEFVQVGSAEARRGGKGLGLSISLRIIEASGGSLKVESEPGKGSTFEIRLPVKAGGAQLRKDRTDRLKGATVLLFAPEGPAARAIIRTVRAGGGACLLCETGESVRDALAHVGIDANPFTDIIVDHRLERHYVGEVAVRAESMGLRRVFLVNPEERQARISGPYDAWLIRPLREQSLVDVLTGRLRGLEKRGATNDNLPHAVTVAPSARADSLSILLGEDDPVNALLVQVSLERAGHRVVLASDFPSLSDRLSGTGPRPDILLTDLNMPGGKGADLIQALRERERREGLAALPVMVLSGEGRDDIRQQLMDIGADRVLAKPVSPGDLLAEVSALAALQPLRGNG